MSPILPATSCLSPSRSTTHILTTSSGVLGSSHSKSPWHTLGDVRSWHRRALAIARRCSCGAPRARTAVAANRLCIARSPRWISRNFTCRSSTVGLVWFVNCGGTLYTCKCNLYHDHGTMYYSSASTIGNMVISCYLCKRAQRMSFSLSVRRSTIVPSELLC